MSYQAHRPNYAQMDGGGGHGDMSALGTLTEFLTDFGSKPEPRPQTPQERFHEALRASGAAVPSATPFRNHG